MTETTCSSFYGYFDENGTIQKSQTEQPYGVFCEIGDDCEWENCSCGGICVECDKICDKDCECNDSEWAEEDEKVRIQDEQEEIEAWNKSFE